MGEGKFVTKKKKRTVLGGVSTWVGEEGPGNEEGGGIGGKKQEVERRNISGKLALARGIVLHYNPRNSH